MSKAFLAILMALSLTACSYFTDKVYTSPQGSITLHQSACKEQAVLDAVGDKAKDFKAAEVAPAGMAKITGCWADAVAVTGDASMAGYVFVVASNGRYAIFPESQFK